MLTHYEILGVKSEATADEIREAYRRKAMELHPDHYAGRPGAVVEAATLAMAQVNRAHDVLSDPRARADYDRSVHREIHEDPAPPRPRWSSRQAAASSRVYRRPSPANDRHLRSFFAAEDLALPPDLLAGDGTERLTIVRAARALIDDVALGRLASVCPALEELDIAGTAVTDDGLAHLLRLPRLHALDISFTKVTDRGLETLGRLASLETLTLVDLDVSDRGMVDLARLPSLEFLSLRGTRVTAVGLAALERVPLRTLVMPPHVPRAAKKQLMVDHGGIFLI